MDPPRGLPENLGTRSPSEESLNLTVVLGDGTVGDVGSSCPGVGAPTTTTGKVASGQDRDEPEPEPELEQGQVREPLSNP